MITKTITIPWKEYCELVAADSELYALYEAGVDNWEGYEDAMDYFSSATLPKESDEPHNRNEQK